MINHYKRVLIHSEERVDQLLKNRLQKTLKMDSGD